MQEYKGISKADYPKWKGWGYIACFSAITDDFDDDKPLQKLVKRHYFKIKLHKALFNFIPYFIILGIILLNK